MKSMTGYALTEKTEPNSFVSLEIKSYNSRYLDLNLNFPFWLSALEPIFRAYFSEKIARGKVEVSLHVKDADIDVDILTNTKVAKAYAKAMREVAKAAGINPEIDINRFSEKDGVIIIERNIDISAWENTLLPIFEETFIKYDKTRLDEGSVLKKDILSNLDRIYASLKVIKKYAPQMEEIFCQNIKGRFTELLGSEINEQRIMQEVAVMLVKYTINEEIIRAKAHIAALEKEITENEAPGRRIDFLCQEINREINTIGSKNQLTEIGQAVISAKDALENIREQAHNIE